MKKGGRVPRGFLKTGFYVFGCFKNQGSNARAIKVSGYSDNEFYYHKWPESDMWTVSDPMSGMRITEGVTLKDAQESARVFRSAIAKAKQTDRYSKTVSDFYKAQVECGAIVEL